MSDRPTMEEAAHDALIVQDACNMGAVFHAFSRAMLAVQEDCRAKGTGTDGVRNHPVTVLFMDKMNDMMGKVHSADYYYSYEICARLANWKEEPANAIR